MYTTRDSKLPWLSIIVPAFNEERYIEECISSILSLDLEDDEYEVIIVDNASTDSTPDIIRKFEIARYLLLETGNVGAVRNFGAHAARGRILAFIDADCVLDPTWASRAKRLAMDNDSMVFGGGCRASVNAHWVERYWLLTQDDFPTLPQHLIGASIVIRKAVFSEIGGFNEDVTSGEDTDLSLSLSRNGYSVVMTHELDVTHLGNAKTLTEFFRRQIWHAENYLKNPAESLKDPIFLLTLTFITLIAGSGLSLLTPISPTLSFSTLCTALALPIILSVKRAHRTKLSPYTFLKGLLPIYALDLTYLAGRGVGLIKSAI